MDTWIDISLGEAYKSVPQQSRVISESWIGKNMYCPRCGYPYLTKCKNNRPVADFTCSQCQNIYEVKASAGMFGHKINDGAYGTMMERIHSDTNPDFLFFTYEKRHEQVQQLFMVPKYYITDRVIEKRKPLGPTARRAGWIGCFIHLDGIPEAGRITIIKNGLIREKEAVCRQYGHTEFLGQINVPARGWLLDILHCIERIPHETFSLEEVYQFERQLQILHPENHTIRAKIRQQLQILRDKALIEFVGRGIYRKKF